MGKPIDKNNSNKNLDELLGHLHNTDSHQNRDDLDAFEQEALEGFAMLESSQEALDIKKRLDERMEEKFSEKRKPLFIYWSAAAGLALIIGLVFLLKTNQDLSSESGLADNKVLNEAQLENNVNNPAAPPAELKQETGKLSGKGGKSEEMMNESQNSQMGYKNSGPLQKSAEQVVTTKSEESSIAMDEVAEPTKEGEKDADNKAKPLDDLAKNDKNQNIPASATGGSKSNGDADLASKTKDKEESDKRDEDKATNYFSRKIKKEKKAAEPATTESKPKSEIDGAFEKSTIQKASLSIKESELTEKINKFLSNKDYKKSFVCTLTINSDDKVESIVFQNPDLFHKSEQKEILEFFKKQKCFKNHEFSVYSTYTINYKSQ